MILYIEHQAETKEEMAAYLDEVKNGIISGINTGLGFEMREEEVSLEKDDVGGDSADVGLVD